MRGLEVLQAATGWNATPDRMAAISLALEGAGYTVAQVLLAVKDLAFDIELGRALRFEHSTIQPSDFKRVIEGDDTAAAKARLYSYPRMLERFERLGGGREGGPTMDALFEAVETPDGKRWRER